jgi:hypothetical protein
MIHRSDHFVLKVRQSNSTGTLTYVEGYVMCPGQPPVHHAWIALDDKHAVELTIRSDPQVLKFFGVSFSRAELWKILEEEMTFGVFAYPPRPGLRDFMKQMKLGHGRMR